MPTVPDGHLHRLPRAWLSRPCRDGAKKRRGRGVHGWRGDGNPHDLLPAHLRICVLENLIVRAAGLGPGDEEGCAFLEVLREARRIVGKKKEGRANG